MRLILFLSAIILSGGCIEVQNSYTHLPPGQWRGIMKLSDPALDVQVAEIETDARIEDYFELPFNFEVMYHEGQMQVALLNGAERIPVEDVHIGRDPRTARDTVRFEFTAFDTYMDGYYEENLIEGKWYVNYKDGYSIPFIAYYGQDHRFETDPNTPPADFSGEWYATFEYDTKDSYPAIAIFEQEGDSLGGTFRTETGDYRFLEGNVTGDNMKMSVFDGAHAFLFSARMSGDTIFGEFRSGKHYVANWKATRKKDQKLRDPYMMTRSDRKTIDNFSFQSSDGKEISLDDPIMQGKVKLLNIMGTWCPNCRDEIKFLKQIREEYGDDVAIISLAFERYRDEKKALSQLQKYKDAMEIKWPLLLGGYANKSENSRDLDFLDTIYSYPTLLVLDEANRIRYIHTGFYGPATPEYTAYTTDFRNKLNAVLNE